MASSVIWIDYRPRLYQDLLLKVFEHVSHKRVGRKMSVIVGPLQNGLIKPRRVAIAILSLDRLTGNLPDIKRWLLAGSKLIVIHPSENYGWVLHKHSKGWEIRNPFELSELISEVFSL